jgi:serine/threonine protein kinase
MNSEQLCDVASGLSYRRSAIVFNQMQIKFHLYSSFVLYGSWRSIRCMYLNSSGCVHSGLLTCQSDKSNVLIDDEGRACVADFGMSKIAAEFQGTSYFTSSIGGAIRWAAPELYCVYEDHMSPVATAASDVYSYGSLTLQVCGIVPP